MPALLPFLIDQRGISYGAAGALVLVTSVGSSAIQPLFGLGSDRLSLPWLMPLGVLLAGLGVALVGHHVELPGHRRRGGAQRPRRRGLPSRRGALRQPGLGRPPRAGHELLLAGRQRGLRARARSSSRRSCSSSACAGRCCWPSSRRSSPSSSRASSAGCGRVAAEKSAHVARNLADDDRDEDDWNAFVRLGGVVALRSCVYFGLQAFIPLWFIHQLGTGEGAGNAALTAMLVAGAVGTYSGGRVVDRVGRRRLVVGLDRPHHPGPRRARARPHPADGRPAHRPGGLPHHPHLLDHRRHEPGVPAQPPRPRLRA